MIGGWVWGWLIAVVAREIYEREREGEREREERRGRKKPGCYIEPRTDWQADWLVGCCLTLW
jgi:hypothetical protein